MTGVEAGYQISPIQRRLHRVAAGGEETWQARLVWQTDLPSEQVAAAVAAVCGRHEVTSSAFVVTDPAMPPLQLPGHPPRIRVTGDAAEVALVGPEVLVVATGDRLEIRLPALAADLGSLPLLAREVLAELGLGGETPVVEPAEHSMMAQWLHEFATSPEAAVGRAYWERMAAVADAVPPPSSDPPARIGLALTAEETRTILGLAANLGVPVRALLLTVWAGVLSRLDGSDDVTVGTYVDGRADEDVRDMMGPLGRYLPLRWAGLNRQPYGAAARTVADVLTEAEAYAESFLAPPNVGFRYGFAYADLPDGDARLRPVDADCRTEPFSAALTALRVGDTLRVTLSGNPGRVDAHLADALACALRHLPALPHDAVLGRVALVGEEQARRLLALGRSAPAPHPDSVLDLFAEQVRVAPARPAVDDVTYADLDLRARRCAAAMSADGVGPGSTVLVRLPRGVALVATLLGAWRLGATVVLIDPDLPPGRVAEIAADAGATVTVEGDLAPGTGVIPDVPARPGERAYVVYTSGSTGRPKGVVVGHRAFATHCAAMARAVALTSADRVAFLASPGFDVALEQIFTTLVTGAHLHTQPAPLPTPDELSAFIAARRITVLNVTPSLWELLGGHWSEQSNPLDGLRTLILGAERLGVPAIDLAGRLVPQAAVFNAYGPTETVVTATLNRVAGPADADVIGAPVGGRQVLVLDEFGQLEPPGAIGELAIAGPCLADGYHNLPGLTAERFVAHPLPQRPAEATMFRTGDLVRMRPDGKLIFEGRRDRQVKLRGQRVELDEIETRAAAYRG